MNSVQLVRTGEENVDKFILKPQSLILNAPYTIFSASSTDFTTCISIGGDTVQLFRQQFLRSHSSSTACLFPSPPLPSVCGRFTVQLITRKLCEFSIGDYRQQWRRNEYEVGGNRSGAIIVFGRAPPLFWL